MKLDSPTRNTEAWETVANGPPRGPRYSNPKKSPKNASLSARFFTGRDQWVSRSAPSTSHLVSAGPPPPLCTIRKRLQRRDRSARTIHPPVLLISRLCRRVTSGHYLERVRV